MKDITFVNNFWDKDTNGYKVIVNRINHSLTTQQELLDYYQQRIDIEKEYTNKLEKLNQRPMGSYETGTLKKSLNKLNYENIEMVKCNQKFVKLVNQINYGKLLGFYQMYQKRTKKLLGHMNKLVDKRLHTLKSLQLAKIAYKDTCSNIKTLKLAIQTTWGKELEQYEKKLNKLQQTLSLSEKNYKLSVDNFNKINDLFKRDWLITLNEVYQLEIERIQLIKVNCFNFCNNIATYCVDIDQASDLARGFFAKVTPPQDLQDFSNQYGVGDQICGDFKFIDFMEGLDDENDFSFDVANFTVPEVNQLLARSYSTYSHATNSSVPLANNPILNSVPKLTKTEDTKSSTSNQSPDEKTDIFSLKFNESNGSSNYSDPTNYTTNSDHGANTSKAERTWSSPRRRNNNPPQNKPNLQTKELPALNIPPSIDHVNKMPPMKDFSIDFIAKALEDLNQGGNGDIDQYRKSVRAAQNPTSMPATPRIRHDNNEIPTRFDSISFKSPKFNRTALNGSPRNSRPKSMYGSINYSEPKRTLSKSPTKSFTNLYSIIDRITPVTRKPYLTKAVTKYNYKSQHAGELSFKKYWHLYIIHKQEDNWYLCELGDNCEGMRGTVGLVPGNYLEEGDVF